MEKHSQKEERHGEIEKGEDQRERKSEGEDASARKGRKLAKHCVLPLFCGSGRSKSRLAIKAAGAEAAGQRTDEKLQAGVARSTF